MGINYEKNPIGYTDKDYSNYKRLMMKTNALHVGNKPGINKPRSSKSYKWINILSPIWYGGKSMRERGLWLFQAILTRC